MRNLYLLLAFLVCGSAMAQPYKFNVPMDASGIVAPAVVAANTFAKIGDITAALGPTAAPAVSASGGTYLSSVSVSLSCVTANSTIYYTTDGSTPTTSSSVYSTPFTFSSTTTLKAVAKNTVLALSSVTTATYTVSAGSTVYYGQSASTSLSSGGVTGLGSSFTGLSAFPRTYIFSSSAQYCYFAWPDSFGSPSALPGGFSVGGFMAAMEDNTDGLSSNANGWYYSTVTISATTYRVYRSKYPLNATTFSVN